jgi:transposase
MRFSPRRNHATRRIMMTTPLEAQLTEEVKALRLENQRVVQENKLLREKVDLLVRRIFGKSSEAMDESQLMLMLQGDEAKKPAASCDPGGLEAELQKGDKELKARPVRRKEERKPRLPENLPVGEEIIVEPAEVKAEPQAYRHMGDEVTEQLDYTPAKFSKRRIIRRKYVKRDAAHQAPVIAALDTLAERSLAAPGLLAQIIIAKYCDHLPLYRQEQSYKLRHGIEIPRQSMARWLGLAADWLRPIYERIHTGVMAGGYVQTDETKIEYLQPGHGQTKHGYFWTLKATGGDAVFHWRTGRSAEALGDIIPADFRGTIGCDGYSVYQSRANHSDGTVRLAACWAHVRRKFDEAKEASPRHAAVILLHIQKLYLIEKRLRERKASAKLRLIERQNHSRLIVEKIGRQLRSWKKRETHLPQSHMGKAIDYTLTLWSHLQEYLQDGRIEIDNNLVENAIRPTAIGKKNWLFIGEAEAGERSAIHFTIIEACRRRSIDPWEYLREVLTRLPTMTTAQLDEVMPDAWLKARQPQKRPAVLNCPAPSQAAA